MTRRYLAQMFHALSTQALRDRGQSLEALAAEASTQDGLNRQALDEIRAAGGIEVILAALDAVRARLGEAVPERLERD